METSKLKKFAQFARRSLLEQVTAKLKLVLADESPARRERPQAIKKLEEAVTDQGKEQVIERVAYIWFNRFCALRFMDVNRYNRIGIVSPAEGQFQPEILADAKMDHIDEEMVSESTRQKIFALLDGKTPSQDPQGEAYRLLVVAACNYWYSAMPFLFERIDDYTELLMPDDLLSGNSILSYTREAMTPDVMPKRLLVIGSGAIGIEFASFFQTLGSQVTVVEVMDRILPVEDADVSKFAAKSFKKQGMNLMTSTEVLSLTPKDGAVDAVLKSKKGEETQTFDRVILAVGIVGNVEGLGLEAAGIKVEKTHVVVNEWGETGVKGVAAIGDLAGPPWLAHKASHEGVVAVERLAGHEGAHPLDTGNIPGCTYCHPQIASVGLTEQKAKDNGLKVRTGQFPFQANGKALALGEAEGFIKTVFDDKTGALLGAHMIGAEVTELIQGFAIARQLETTEAELMQTVFPHPTLSEMMHEAVLDAYGRTIHF